MSLNRKKYSSRDGFKFNDACPALFPVCLDISKGRQKKIFFFLNSPVTYKMSLTERSRTRDATAGRIPEMRNRNVRLNAHSIK